MTQADAYKEEISSQIPAVQVQLNLGWQYLWQGEALALRGGKESSVVLSGVLEPWLHANNQISYKGQRHAFSDATFASLRTRTLGATDAQGSLFEQPPEQIPQPR